MKNNVYTILLLVIVFLTSCLKDDRMLMDPSKSYNVLEFVNVSNIVRAGTTTSMFTKAVNLKPEVSVEFEISYSGAEDGAPQDILVDFGIGDEEILTQYNKENGTTYLLLPDNLSDLKISTVTIPKGKKRAKFTVTFKPTEFDLSKSFVLPLVIKSASYGVISRNFSKILVNVSPKNKYDGIYKVDVITPLLDVTTPNITGFYPMNQELRTRQENSVGEWDFNVRAPYNYYHPIRSSGNPSVYGNFAPVFVMDANDNIVEVINYYGQGNNANGRGARIDITGANKWTINGASKTFEVKYVMVERGVDRTFFHEKWTYIQERP